MIFSTESAFNIEKNDKAFLEAGIHENVALIGVRKEKSTNGNSFIEFEFEKDGAKTTHTEWEPTKRDIDTEEAFNSKVNNQVARILQIMSAFYAKEHLSFTAATFEQFGNWVQSLLNSVDKTRLVRLKVVYGATGYTSLPKYAKYTFIESMEIPADKSKIKALAIDVFIRPELGDNEKSAKSSSEVFGSAKGSENSSKAPF